MRSEEFRGVFPKAKTVNYIEFWDDLCRYADLTTPERRAMFLANVGHENAGFTKFEENLNYSAAGLARVWPGRYASQGKPNALALSLAHKPELIANITYANRMGNGPAASGDGWRYRGRGDIMTTFKNNYKSLDDEFYMNGKIISNPDMLLQPYWSRMSAGFFWKRNGVNRISDTGNIEAVRKRVNGGLIGIEDVKKLYQKLIEIV